MLFGKTFKRKVLKFNDLVARLVTASAAGNGIPRPVPGCMILARKQPRRSEMIEAVMNQSRDFAPTRPTDLLSPMLAMPETTVLNTRGAMIIFIRRRKMSLAREK